jgi:hypothetical protein
VFTRQTAKWTASLDTTPGVGHARLCPTRNPWHNCVLHFAPTGGVLLSLPTAKRALCPTIQHAILQGFHDLHAHYAYRPKVKNTPSNVCSFMGQAVPSVHRLPVVFLSAFHVPISSTHPRLASDEVLCHHALHSGIFLGFPSSRQVMVLSNLARNTELAHLKLQAAWSIFSNWFFSELGEISNKACLYAPLPNVQSSTHR